MLRLHDLPPGYVPFDFSEGGGHEFLCDDLDPAHPSAELARFVRRFSPHGCLGIYVRVYSVPGVETSGTVVGTGALDAGGDEAAEMGFSLVDQLLGKVTENGIPEEVAPTATVGDATRLFHWKRAPRLFRNSHFGSFLVWRSGTVLNAVFASANSLAASDVIVATLAKRQLEHVEHPTPYTRAERNTSEIGLDDPALTLPVYWLGRNFAPGHGLPVARLEWGGASSHDSETLPNQKLELQYSHDLQLSSWTRAGWRRFLATAVAREIFEEPCLRSEDLPMARGRVAIYAGHVEGFDPCLGSSPRRFFAVAYLDDVVVAINLNSCRDCPEPARGSFNSPAGMKTVVRSLRFRPAPDY